MIKITKSDEATGCKCCNSKHDVHDITLGKDDRATITVALCFNCRKQLSNMLTKRVK